MFINLSIIIIVALLVATLFIEFQIAQSALTERLNNRKRIKSWWLILAICLPIFYLGGTSLSVFVFILSIWACWEFFRLLNFERRIFEIILMTGVIIIAYTSFSQSISNSVLILCIPLIFLLLSLYIQQDRVFYQLIISFFIISSLASIISIDSICKTNNLCQSSFALLYLFFMTSINDISQYISGKLFGRTALAPKLSPSKTVEGAMGGVLFTSILGLFTLPSLIDTNWQTSLFISFVLSVMGIAGDLFTSIFKRQANVKNSGNSIPGHGGLLDRIDSLLFTAPTFSLSLLIFTG